jgi:DNA-binding transcriptional ArsR family regulator
MTNTHPLDALADPTRRRIFERLRDGPRSVGELVEQSGVSQPAVSQHLRALREARLVRVQKAGQQRIYSVDPAGLNALRAYVEAMWTGVLAAFAASANFAGADPAGANVDVDLPTRQEIDDDDR